jgi:tetratricopeptide (TPR) repeat protein
MPVLCCVVVLLAAAFQQVAPDVDSLLGSGREYYAKGDFEQSRRDLEEAWKRAEELPRDDSRRYEVVKQLAATLSAGGDYDAAENYLQIAINWKEQQKVRNIDLAPDLIELALLCRARQDYERGLVILQRVMTFYLPSGGADNPAAADVLSLMGVLNLDMKRFDEAVPVLELALKARETELGPTHVGLLPDLDRLGPALLSLRAYDKAEIVWRRSLMIREHLNGRLSAELIPSLDGLAYALFGQKKWDQAEIYYRRLLDVWQFSAGADHPMVPLTLDKLATFYREQARLDDSDRAAARANSIRKLILAKGLYEEARVRLLRDYRDLAERLLRQALTTLDPVSEMHQELRTQIEQELAGFKPKPRVPRTPPRRMPKTD